jgi:hypothetical protein
VRKRVVCDAREWPERAPCDPGDGGSQSDFRTRRRRRVRQGRAAPEVGTPQPVALKSGLVYDGAALGHWARN